MLKWHDARRRVLKGSGWWVSDSFDGFLNALTAHVVLSNGQFSVQIHHRRGPKADDEAHVEEHTNPDIVDLAAAQEKGRRLLIEAVQALRDEASKAVLDIDRWLLEHRGDPEGDPPMNRMFDNDFKGFAPREQKKFNLLLLSGSEPKPLLLKAELLHVHVRGDNAVRKWWEFGLTYGATALCDLRVYDPALALPFLIAVVEDVFPAEPVSEIPQVSHRQRATDALREIFKFA